MFRQRRQTYTYGLQNYVEWCKRICKALPASPNLPSNWAFGYLNHPLGWQDSAYIVNVELNFAAIITGDHFIFDLNGIINRDSSYSVREARKVYRVGLTPTVSLIRQTN